MLVRLLGPVEVATDREWVRAGPAKRSCVLAALAISPNTAVSMAVLTERVWGPRPPSSAHSTLYGHIAHLRTLLRQCPRPVAIRTAPADGYILDVDPDAIDVHAARNLATTARRHGKEGDMAAAVRAWRAAARLVLAEPLAGIGGEWATQVRSAIHSEHAAVLTELYTAELDLGRHETIVAELGEHVTTYPVAEGLAECLMTALYRCGRQAEALDQFTSTRTRLADRLGADPGPRLRELHRRILNQDRLLTHTATVTPAAPVPSQLPAAPRWFSGRDSEITALDAALADPNRPRAWNISGPGGMGKSWLALHWAHNNRAAFPDGQLYVNLHGFDAAAQPVPPLTALRGLLHSLGTPATAIPESLDAAAGVYRSLTSGKRMLIVIDDARDSAAVIPLLPGDPTCFTVITSRPDLTALAASHGTTGLRLSTLTATEAHAAFAIQLGSDRMDSQPQAAAQLLQACAGLPLAVGILAARAATWPDLPLSALADSLRHGAAPLDAFDTGELSASLRTVIGASVAALSPPAARLFALLGLAPGGDATVFAIASLAAAPADRPLRELEGAGLVEQHEPRRYRMHDLTRSFALELSTDTCGDTEQSAARRRLVDHYLHTAVAARLLMQPATRARDTGTPVPGCVVTPLPDAQAATRWFEREHRNIIDAQQCAADNGWDDAVWLMAWALFTFHVRRSEHPGQLLVWQRAATAARRLGDAGREGTAHRNIGNVHCFQGDTAVGLQHLQTAVALAETSRDTVEQAFSVHALAMAHSQAGDHRQALRHSTAALALARGTAGQGTIEVSALNAVGWHHAHLGEYGPAREQCEAALRLARQHGDGPATGDVLDSLGYIAFRTGRLRQARDYYRQALEVYRRFEVRRSGPDVMTRLADADDAMGLHTEAVRLRRDAAAEYEAQGYGEAAARLRTTLDTRPGGG